MFAAKILQTHYQLLTAVFDYRSEVLEKPETRVLLLMIDALTFAHNDKEKHKSDHMEFTGDFKMHF